MAGLLLGAGTLGDRIGHRRMFVIGLSIFGVASAAAAFSLNPAMLIVLRGVLAIGAAAMMPATLALIRVTFEDERERSIAIGVWSSLAVVGGALGPIVSGLLLAQFCWGSVFLVNVSVVVTAIVATLVLAPRNDADPTKRWDLLSSILALVALEGLVVGVKELVKVEGSGWTVLSFDGHIALFVVALTFTGMGVSAAIAVASSAIIGNVPVSRAGMASSIEEVSYEFGSLAAVALLGSLVSFCVHLPHRATERH